MAQHWVATGFGDLDVFALVDVDVPAPKPGEVTIEMRAVGMNPADYKHVQSAGDRSTLPIAVGYELAGVISAVGDDTTLASGGGAVGDEVVAFRLSGGYTSAITVAAADVFAKPSGLGFPEAANLLLAGTTAAEMLHVTGVKSGDTVLLHGASGAVGVSVIQQAKLLGARVIGTGSEKSFATIERFGAEPVAYGDGLEQRVRELAPNGIDAALDAVGTDEAVAVSLALVSDHERIVTIVAFAKAKDDGFTAIGGTMPKSIEYRDSVRGHLIDLAGSGDLVVPVARTFPLSEGRAALDLLKNGHPGGKVALVSE